MVLCGIGYLRMDNEIEYEGVSGKDKDIIWLNLFYVWNICRKNSNLLLLFLFIFLNNIYSIFNFKYQIIYFLILRSLKNIKY